VTPKRLWRLPDPAEPPGIEGLRQRWLTWGYSIGFQPQQYGVMKFPRGEVKWKAAVAAATEDEMESAWQALEKRQNSVLTPG
jgi:hypothetical protein